MADRTDVLVIDDEQPRLEQLVAAIQAELQGIRVKAWQPEKVENSLERFNSEVPSVGLIVTDQDLTKAGSGLLGSTITTWAQDTFLPVCNFSRQPQRKLPRESNFFELRVPREEDEQERARYIARIYHGFDQLRTYIEEADEAQPTAKLLADSMGTPELQDDLAPYLTSVGYASSSFMQTVLAAGTPPTGRDRDNFLAFILGHILVNAVLEFPGPIISQTTLAAYCAMSDRISEQLATLFADAAYIGPFSAPNMYFQRRLVDAHIDELAVDLDDQPDEPDQYNRKVVQRALKLAAPHGCQRCNGTRGGLWCPFTKRAVCNRADCSVASNTWIPRGATLCRVEREYFDEWAPLLGE